MAILSDSIQIVWSQAFYVLEMQKTWLKHVVWVNMMYENLNLHSAHLGLVLVLHGTSVDPNHLVIHIPL